MRTGTTYEYISDDLLWWDDYPLLWASATGSVIKTLCPCQGLQDIRVNRISGRVDSRLAQTRSRMR